MYCMSSEFFMDVLDFSKHGCFEVVRIFSTPAGADHTAELNIALLGNEEA